MSSKTFNVTAFFFRNALKNSGMDENIHTRLMSYQGEQVIWDHVIECYKADRRVGWSLTRLTSEAVFLNNFSKMKVKLMEMVSIVYI